MKLLFPLLVAAALSPLPVRGAPPPAKPALGMNLAGPSDWNSEFVKHFDAWTREGGDLLCHFSSVSVWNKWGSWGLLQFADEDGATSPKFMAAMHWAKSLNQPVNAPGDISTPS